MFMPRARYLVTAMPQLAALMQKTENICYQTPQKGFRCRKTNKVYKDRTLESLSIMTSTVVLPLLCCVRISPMKSSLILTPVAVRFYDKKMQVIRKMNSKSSPKVLNKK
jgi:hypothetical protein